VETAALVGERLGIYVEAVEGLHEHERRHVPIMELTALESLVADFFARPRELVFGDETAAQAMMRFSRAVNRLIRETGEGNLVIVAHGTVISLFVAARNHLDPYELWKRLDLPSYVVLALPALTLLEVGERVD
jgi:broad specificity phosphatase PhoE